MVYRGWDDPCGESALIEDLISMIGKMIGQMRIGIIAPSSKVPQTELSLGIRKIREQGFRVDVHPQCKKSHLFFSGTDEQRASAFFEFSKNPAYSALWCARGGHGAIRVLPYLERWTKEQGAPSQKLLIGYSDSTALMEFVRKNWGWSILHAPMPSMRKFTLLPESDWEAMTLWIGGQKAEASWAKQRLKFINSPPLNAVQAPLLGGNLTVWNCLTGTPFQPQSQGAMLFLEDIDEHLYRVDRVLQQLLISGAFEGISALVLGNFLNCNDTVPLVLESPYRLKNMKRALESPKKNELKPLRKKRTQIAVFKEIFGELGERLQIPVAYGLPVGHGPEVSPLPLGAEYRLTPQGLLELVNWNWISG